MMLRDEHRSSSTAVRTTANVALAVVFAAIPAAMALASCAVESSDSAASADGGDRSAAACSGEPCTPTGAGSLTGGGGGPDANQGSDADAPVDGSSKPDAGPKPDGGSSSGGATHGAGTCGGGFGPTNDLAHVPPCPNTARALYDRHAISRATYYHDGIHGFEPQHVVWSDALAATAQEYAERYAAGQSPNGKKVEGIAYDPYWDGSYGGYRAIAGMETPTSCDCPPPTTGFYKPPAPVFYNLGSANFRAHVVQIDGYSKMGVGHVGTADGRHFWALLFAH